MLLTHCAALATASFAAASMRSTTWLGSSQGGDAAARTLVHGDGGDGGNQGFGKVAQRLVAGEQRHGDAVISGGVGIDEEFTAQRAVEENVVVPAVHGVAQGIAGAACPGVVAGEEHGVKFLLIQAAHHASGGRRTIKNKNLLILQIHLNLTLSFIWPLRN